MVPAATRASVRLRRDQGRQGRPQRRDRHEDEGRRRGHTRVVEDRVYVNGRFEERTLDYYTQHKSGDVWYFGEDTAELNKNGKVTSTEGTWHAGVDGAIPGDLHGGEPQGRTAFRQEW